MFDNTSRVIEVDIDEILPNRFQPRIQFDEEEILELSDSIKEHGVIQPIVVRTIGDKYEIIAGERRYKASVLAGKETVPVIVKNLNDKDSAEIALIENVQRKNLTPIEEALSYKKILDMGYITQDKLASKLGKSQSSIANKIRLLNLSDEVQEALLENKISERHARSLLKLETSNLQNEMLNRIIQERLTVRRTDEEIAKLKNIDESSDEENDDSTKIIEKGEINMNNNDNIFGIPNIPQNPQQPTQSFDIFGLGTQQPQSIVNSQPTQVMPTEPSFDIFGGGNSTPVQPNNMIPSVSEEEDPTGGGFVQTNAPVDPITETPVVPAVEPQTPEVNEIPSIQPIVEPEPVQTSIPAMGGIQFDGNGNIISAPTMETPVVPTVEPQTPEVNEIPSIQPIVEPEPVQPSIPAMGGIQFDGNRNVVSAPIAETPAAPTLEPQTPEITELPNIQPISEPTIPQTSPIIESPVVENPTQMTQQAEDLFSFGVDNKEQLEQPEQQSSPEFKIPEPIIVTDYSKQYDPIMPQTSETVTPKVEFKEVINAIRECSQKIEQYGFKIDVEEYDLLNLYQVIFKIEK